VVGASPKCFLLNVTAADIAPRMVFAEMVEDLLSDQDLIGRRREAPYSWIERAIAIVGSSAGTTAERGRRAAEVGSKGHGVGRGLRVAERDPFAKKGPKNKRGEVPNASESLSIKLRAWGDGTRSVVIGARPGADPRAWVHSHASAMIDDHLLVADARRQCRHHDPVLPLGIQKLT
jgi:hypothetical protein